jgi:adenylosuccinate synthase
VLHPLIEESSVVLVPGAYFGDEGKGKTVDAIARHPAV